jgi:hypothetical protein
MIHDWQSNVDAFIFFQIYLSPCREEFIFNSEYEGVSKSFRTEFITK